MVWHFLKGISAALV